MTERYAGCCDRGRPRPAGRPARPPASCRCSAGRAPARRPCSARSAIRRRRWSTLAAAAGAGKSRLLAELAAALDRPVLTARAYLPERAEPWSLARGLLRAALATDREHRRRAARTRRAGAARGRARTWPTCCRRRPAAPLDPATRRALVLEGAVRMLVAAAPAVAARDPGRPAVGRPGQPARRRRPARPGARPAGGAGVPAGGGAGGRPVWRSAWPGWPTGARSGRSRCRRWRSPTSARSSTPRSPGPC